VLKCGERQHRHVPGDGPPRGPPIAGAGGGPGITELLDTKQIVVISLLALAVGAAAAMVPKYLL